MLCTFLVQLTNLVGKKSSLFYFPTVKWQACYILEFWMNLKTLWALQQLLTSYLSYTWQCSAQFSRKVMSNSLWDQGLQYTRFPCPSSTPRACSNLISIESVLPSSRLMLCHPFLHLPSIFPSIMVFSNESVLRIRWPKYWSFSFSISPSSEYWGLISKVSLNCCHLSNILEIFSMENQFTGLFAVISFNCEWNSSVGNILEYV